MKKTPSAAIYPVYCENCGWFGMSDDIKYGICNNCREKVKKDKFTEQREIERNPFAYGWVDSDGRYVVEEFNELRQIICISYFKEKGDAK